MRYPGCGLRFAIVARTRLLGWAMLVVLASCSTDGAADTDPTAAHPTAAGSVAVAPSSAAPATTLAAWEAGLSAVGGLDGPVIYGAKPGPDWESGTALVTGELRLLGDCLLIGNRPVVWPYGTRWQADPPGVVYRGGEVLLVGEPVETGGAYYSAPIIDLIPDPAVVELAERCRDSVDRELIVF